MGSITLAPEHMYYRRGFCSDARAYKDHKDDELFKTEKGDKLAKEIVNVCNSFAALCFAAANVEIEQAIKIANFATP